MKKIKEYIDKIKNKKIYILVTMLPLILIVAFFVTRAIAEDDIPANPAFDDYNFYRCVLNSYNTSVQAGERVVGNYNLTDEQLQKIDNLFCQNYKPISSLTGIEKLTSITSFTLSCDGNCSIPSIDLSHNTLLETLNIEGNNTTSLNISNNPNLKTINASNNNLTTIDLSSSPLLESANLTRNNLTSLILGRKDKIKSIGHGFDYDISLLGSSLETLDLTQCPALEKIDFYGVSGTKDNFTQLKLGNKPNLTYLNVSGSKFSTIDLENSPELQEFTINPIDDLINLNLKNNKKLKKLNLYLKLETLDLSQNTELTMLDLTDNNLSELDLSHNTKLTDLHLNINLSEIDLSQNTELAKLYFYLCSKLENLDLINNTKLKYLNIRSSRISSLNLSKNNELMFLHIDGYLTNLDLKNLAKLKVLDIENNHLLSLNLTNNSSIVHYDHDLDMQFVTSIGPQTRTLSAYLENGNYKLNLKEYDNNLDPSKVEFTPTEGVTYDNQSGIFTFSDKVKNISYTYKTGLPELTGISEDMKVNLTVKYPPKIKTFYVGGTSNPKYATSTASSIYLDWDDSDVKQYCISTTNSSSGCSWKSTSGNSVTADYNLTTEDGTKTLYAFLKNTDDVISEAKSDEIILDTTAPTIDKFYIGGSSNPEYATSTTSSIYLTWNDADVKQYCVTTTNNNVGCHWTTTSGNNVSETYTLTGSNGTKRVYAYIKDEAGNISEVKEDSIVLDTIKPTIDKFYVGGSSNPEYVTDTNTTVYLTWNDEDVVSYCVNTSNSTNGCNWQNTSNKSVNTSYTLTGSNGNKTLYAYIKDRAGNISEVKEDNVRLDSVRPIIETFYIGGSSNPEYATDTNSTVYLTWQDNDVTDYCISTTNSSNNCEWLKTSGKNVNAEYILQGKNGEITLYAYIKDSAGLISDVKIDTITLNTTKPLIETFYIGGTSNPKYATSTSSSVYLKWTEENITDYCISETNSSDDCDWQTTTGNSVTKTYTLTNGDGTKRLYAYIKNEAGLVSNVASDNIILDTTKPTIDKFYIGGSSNPKYINSKDTNIYATWQDNDVVSYCLSEENSSEKCKWENLSDKVLNTTYSVSSGTGEKKLYLYIKDEAGHISEVKEDSVILDTKIPVIKEFYIADKDTTKITDNKTKITIIHEEEDVESYCISETNSYLSCKWIKSKDKTIEAEYTLPIGNGSKTLYAFIKDEAGNISLLKLAKIELEIPLTNLNSPNENNVDTPLNSSPQTGSKVIGIITITVILISLISIIILKRRNKIYKL